MVVVRPDISIAFCGTHGSGKTTLAKAVAEKLGLPFVGSIARSILQREGISYKMLIKDFWALCDFQRECFERALLLEAPFVTDRSIYDMMAYSVLHLGSSFGWKKVEYTYVFFLPFNPRFLIDDGMRLSDFKFALAVHHQILSILNFLDVRFFRVKSVELEDRVNEVLEVCDGL